MSALRCGSCLRPVGRQFDGQERPYRQFTGTDGQLHTFCVDKDACERRWQGVKDAERFAASEARAYFPEPSDKDDEA